MQAAQQASENGGGKTGRAHTNSAGQSRCTASCCLAAWRRGAASGVRRAHCGLRAASWPLQRPWQRHPSTRWTTSCPGPAACSRSSSSRQCRRSTWSGGRARSRSAGTRVSGSARRRRTRAHAPRTRTRRWCRRCGRCRRAMTRSQSCCSRRRSSPLRRPSGTPSRPSSAFTRRALHAQAARQQRACRTPTQLSTRGPRWRDVEPDPSHVVLAPVALFGDKQQQGLQRCLKCVPPHMRAASSCR